MTKKERKTDEHEEKNDGGQDGVRKIARRAIDASKIMVGVAAVKAADEIQRVVLKFPEKPENKSRREFAREKPTKTFTQAARWVHDVKSTEKKEDKKKGTVFTKHDSGEPLLRPGMDGLISFSLIVAPFAIILGLLFSQDIISVGALLILFIAYIAFIAVPATYLGLDAIYYGAKESTEVLKFGSRIFIQALILLWKGFVELVLLFLNFLFTIIRAAFEGTREYWAFFLTYVLTIGVLSMIVTQFLTIDLGEVDSVILILTLVLIPGLLPASLIHGLWTSLLWRRRNSQRVRSAH